MRKVPVIDLDQSRVTSLAHAPGRYLAGYVAGADYIVF